MSNQLATIDTNQLIAKAMESGDIGVLERMLTMQTQIADRNAKADFIGAMARFQNNCPAIVSLKQGHNYKYAPLEDIIAQVKGTMTDCGLSYRFEQNQDEKNITVTCVITHLSGHSERTTVTATADTSGSKNSVQAIGSTITYLRRYSFTGAMGIVTADQDSDARLAGQAMQEWATVDQVLQIENLIQETSSDREKVMAWICGAANCQIEAFNQLLKKDAQSVISMLKKKAAKND